MNRATRLGPKPSLRVPRVLEVPLDLKRQCHLSLLALLLDLGAPVSPLAPLHSCWTLWSCSSGGAWRSMRPGGACWVGGFWNVVIIKAALARPGGNSNQRD